MNPDASRVHAQGFPFQLSLDHRASRMEEGHAVALKLLEDEPFAPKKASAQPLVEGNGYGGSFGCAEKRVLLANECPALGCRVHGHDFPRVRRRKRHASLRDTLVREVGHEQGFAGEHALPHVHQSPRKPWDAAEPSPMRASKAMSDSIQFMAPASAMTVSCGSNSTSTACKSSPWMV